MTTHATQNHLRHSAVDAAFESMISQPPLCCQSAHRCSRPARWLAIHHQPCSHQVPVCSLHWLAWLINAYDVITECGEMVCTVCGTRFSSEEQRVHFRPL